MKKQRWEENRELIERIDEKLDALEEVIREFLKEKIKGTYHISTGKARKLLSRLDEGG